MDIDEIQAILPHRYPFLLVDRILELEPGESAIGLKNVTASEWWSVGHFPGNPIMPGVLVAEALAQVAGVVFLSAHNEHAGQALYLVGFDKLRFRRPVRPGDTIRLEVKKQGSRRRLWTFDARATVDGHKVADGSLIATAADAG